MPANSKQEIPASALPGKLASAVSSGDLAPLWLIADNEPLLALEAADQIRAAARRLGFEERQVLSLSAMSDWKQIGEAVSGLSLFSAQKIVEIRLASASPGTRGTAALTELASQDLSGLCVMVTVPDADWKVAKLKWFQALAAHAVTVKCDPVPKARLSSWLEGRLKSEGLAIEPDALRYFADQTEGNLLSAAQEVRKLPLLHEGSASPLTLSEIQSAVLDNSRFDVASVSLAAMTGDAVRACRAIDGLSAEYDISEVMPLLLYVFSEDIRKMLSLRTLLDAGQSPQSALRALRIFPKDREAAVSAGARRLSAKKLRNALSVCADIDRLYKGIPSAQRSTDPWLELKSVAVFLAR